MTFSGMEKGREKNNVTLMTLLGDVEPLARGPKQKKCKNATDVWTQYAECEHVLAGH